MEIVKIENLNFNIDKKNILQNINLKLNRGEITTLIGPNGGGKTTIARLIIGALKLQQGVIKKNKNLKIGYLPQKIELDKTLPFRVVDFFNLDIKNNFKKIIKNYPNLNIENLLQNQLCELSGGQLQKVLFLKSLINNPSLLILDEPTQFMDLASINEFYKIIDEVRKANDCAILLISHDLNMVMKKTDQIYCVNGHICCFGKPSEVDNHPEFLMLFGEFAIYQHRHNHKH